MAVSELFYQESYSKHENGVESIVYDIPCFFYEIV